MDPMMPKILDSDKLDDTLDSEYDGSYHLADRSEDVMYISDGDAVNSTQEQPQPRDK